MPTTSSEPDRRAVWDLIISSLQFTRQAFENYSYPDYETRQRRLRDVDEALAVVRDIRRKKGRAA